jgi:hypothetical protein
MMGDPIGLLFLWGFRLLSLAGGKLVEFGGVGVEVGTK